MTCQEYLGALLDGLAEESGEARAADEHERGCAACRERGTTMRTALAGIAALPAGTPAGFAKAAMTRVDRSQAPWEQARTPFWERITEWLTPRLAPLAFGAAAVLVVTVGASRMGTRTPLVSAPVASLQSATPGVIVTPAGDAVNVTVPAQGEARLAMGEVASLSLAGVAEARISQSTRVELSRGTGTFDVNHAKVGTAGFRVATPHALVSVTGTLFAVKVSETESIVEVYSGVVQVASATDPSQAPLTLNAGERARSTSTALLLVKANRPQWAMPGSEATIDTPASAALRPPAPAVGNASGVRTLEKPFGAAPGTASADSGVLKGEAQPGVAPNANVHQPFRP